MLVNGKVVTLVIVDTGSCQTLIDLEMARDLHLVVRKVVGDEFGCYLVPGSIEVKPYYGKVEGRFCVQLTAGVSWELSGIRVVEHGCPLFLLGADVTRGGHVSGWNFSGIRTHTTGPGQVVGCLEFERDE